MICRCVNSLFAGAKSPGFRRIAAAFLAPVILAALSGPVRAAASPWFSYEQGAVRLIAGGATAGTAKRIDLGLEFRLKPHWKVYWRSPGDAGFPPQIDWTGSTNLAGTETAWPAPERFSVLGLETLGYTDHVVLPIEATLREPGKPVGLTAHLRFLTCADICVPYETTLALALPAGPDVNTREEGLLETWRQKVPSSSAGGPLAIERAGIAGTGENQTLVVHVRAQRPLKSPDVFVEGPPDYGFRKPVVQFAAAGREATLRIGVSPPGKQAPSLVGRKVTLTLVDGDRSVERSLSLVRAAAPAPAPSPGSGLGLLAILGLAVLGGLILNLMPCVLPVLSIKMLTVVSHGGETPARIRTGFVASATGIIVCFLLLGSVAVGLKEIGLAVGWGIQFQQPVFLAFMIAVITLFACNMWGFFEIHLPEALADVAAGHGQHHGRDHAGGFVANFLTGAFATLLATPCTAPFLGTAIGFALSRGAMEIYAVFLALGIGLALPWLLVAAFPALVRHLPRPGLWMITLKRFLSIALVGTAIWLLSVLWFQVGATGTAMIALLMAAIGVSIWQYRHLGDRARTATWVVVGLLTAISMIGASGFSGAGRQEVIAKEAEGVWRPFDLSVVAAEVAKGNIVLVDVTADWCLTCQVNKALVIDRGRVAQLIGSHAIVAMKADWTKPDPAIAAYLKSFGRFGIPFNAVYGPSAPQGVPLPELLTEDNVLAAIRKAGGSAKIATR